eukprot:SAG31_NODE_542_length_14269_cov_7.826253_3_plen_67_part_00
MYRYVSAIASGCNIMLSTSSPPASRSSDDPRPPSASVSLYLPKHNYMKSMRSSWVSNAIAHRASKS